MSARPISLFNAVSMNSLPLDPEDLASSSLQVGGVNLRLVHPASFDVNWHAFTRLAIAQVAFASAGHDSWGVPALFMADGSPHYATAYHVFSGGSHSNEGTAWAYVVIAKTTSGLFLLLGHQCGKVTTDVSSQQYMGATVADNYTAELAAIVRGP